MANGDVKCANSLMIKNLNLVACVESLNKYFENKKFLSLSYKLLLIKLESVQFLPIKTGIKKNRKFCQVPYNHKKETSQCNQVSLK